MIPLHEPEFGQSEIDQVARCISSGWVSSVGEVTTRFESAVCGFVGARYAVAMVNGTAALHALLLAAGVNPGDEVIVPTLTFIAPVNAIAYCGARPILADADPDTWQMDVGLVADFLTRSCRVAGGQVLNRLTNRRIAAIVPVHMLGHPVDMDPLMHAAGAVGLSVVEDAAESLGGCYKDRMTGRFGRAACLSFNGNKIITTGGGGMVVTDDEGLANRVRHLATQARTNAAEYVHDAVGFNYRLPALNAALGLAQLERLPQALERKRVIAERYAAAIGSIPGFVPMPRAPWAQPNHWLYTVGVASGEADCRDALLRHLAADGIQARGLWRPAHLQIMYKDAERIGGEVAERVYASAVSLPTSPALTPDQQDTVISSLRSFSRSLD